VDRPRAVPGAEALTTLIERASRFVFVTNNPGAASDYAERLRGRVAADDRDRHRREVTATLAASGRRAAARRS
jgi:ribonucleotide monophosphatase NagD (HAD superfamily)